MELSGKDLRAIHEALLDAFRSHSDLAQFMMFSMTERLDAIVSEGSLNEVVFRLVQWAVAHGRAEELLINAAEARPKNSLLEQVVHRLGLAGKSSAGRPEDTEKLADRRSYRFGASLLSLEFGDITSSTAEVLVSSDDYYLSMGGGVSMAILNAAGRSIALEAAKAAPAALGDVIVTSAGRLAARHVFHAVTVGPERGNVDVPDTLRKIIRRSFELMNVLGVHSIAFPAIGTGSARFPLNDVAALMADIVVSELDQRPTPLAVTIYLRSPSGPTRALDYVAFFEQFAAKAPRVAAHATTSDAAGVVRTEILPKSMGAVTAEHVRSQRLHQLYQLISQVNEQAYRLELALIALASGADRTTLEKELSQNEALKHRFYGELETLNKSSGPPLHHEEQQVRSVFLSSTYRDLETYRAAVKDQITKRNMLFKGMELFGADPSKAPATLIVDEVRKADVFVGVLGARYGFIDGATGLSMTELEFNAARAAGKPMLLYVMDENASVPLKHIEQSTEGMTKLDALRGRIMHEHTVEKFSNPDDLAGKVYADLGKLTG